MKKVTFIDTRAMKAIRASSADIQAIAGIINEEGARLIEDYGHEAVNVLSLVNFQLVRLIDGSIIKCINPNCNTTFTLADLDKNPLIMACCKGCAIESISISTQAIMENLRIDIPQIEARLKGEMLILSSSAVRKGDIVDKAQVQGGGISERLLKEKITRLGYLTEVMVSIQSGSFSLGCATRDCDEEIPLPSRLSSPENGYCVACQEEKRASNSSR